MKLNASDVTLSAQDSDGAWHCIGQPRTIAISPEAYKILQAAEDPLTASAIRRRWENASTKN